MPIARLALSLACSVVQSPAAVDPMLDPAIWGFGGIGGPRPGTEALAEPIVPRAWAIVPRASGMSAETALARWILDPDAVPPTLTGVAGDLDLAKSKWLEDDGSHLDGAVCASTRIDVDAEHVRLARLAGGAWLVVNGEVFVGDRQRRGYGGVPVVLRKGANHVFVANGDRGFELELVQPATRMVIEAFDVRWPESADVEDVSYPVFNASTSTVPHAHVHYGHAHRWSGSCKPALTDWRCNGYAAPLCSMLGGSYYLGMWTECDHGIDIASRDVIVPVCVYAVEGEVADRKLLRRSLDAHGRAWNNLESVARDPGPTVGRLVPPSSELVHVYATQGSDDEDRASLATARLAQQLAWYEGPGVPVVVSDVDYLDLDHRGRPWHRARPVVLYGNADTNAAWSRIVGDGSQIDARRGRALVERREHRGDSIAGRLQLAGSDGFVVYDTGVAGARLASLLALAWRGPRSTHVAFEVDPTSASGWRDLEDEGR